MKEQEITEIRGYLKDCEEKLDVKSEAIEKAQKVINKLNDELDRAGEEVDRVS